MVTLETLMQDAGVSAYPARWADVFDEVMADYEAHGTPLTDPAFYEGLRRQYGVLGDLCPLYQKAGLAVAQSETLCRLLALMTNAMADRAHAREDFAAFQAPVTPGGGRDLAYDMLPALAICSTVPYTYNLLKKRGLPEHLIMADLRRPEDVVCESYQQKFGMTSPHMLTWYQLSIDGQLFRLGRLEMQAFATWSGHTRVFADKTGRHVMLADGLTVHKSGRALGSFGCEDEADSRVTAIEETETAFCGYPVKADSLVDNRKLTLKKAEWRPVLCQGDPTVGVHIPEDGPMSGEEVDDALKQARALFDTYFPEFDYRAFTCYSWLMDPQIETLLEGRGNLVNFGRRFMRVTQKSSGKALFHFMYHYPIGVLPPFEELPEATRLERAIKAHYLSGKRIYETGGCFMK